MLFIAAFSMGTSFAFGGGTLHFAGTAGVDSIALYNILFRELYADEFTADLLRRSAPPLLSPSSSGVNAPPFLPPSSPGVIVPDGEGSIVVPPNTGNESGEDEIATEPDYDNGELSLESDDENDVSDSGNNQGEEEEI